MANMRAKARPRTSNHRAIGRFTVAVSTVGARAAGAVSVPVAAVIAGPGGKAAVRQPVAGEKADRVVPVTTGIVAGGWVEIRSGLEAGDEVRLPS